MSDHHQPVPTTSQGLFWGNRTLRRTPARNPDALAEEILALMSDGRFSQARRLASRAVARFPKHDRLRRLEAVFDSRGKSRISPMGPQPSTHEEFEWLRNPPEWARGKLVALVGSEAVASADSLDELQAALGGRKFSKTPLVVQIDDVP